MNNSRLIRKAASNYQIQIFDSPEVTRVEKLSKQITFRVRVTGQPLDPNHVIPAILPEIQSYVSNQYSTYDPDPIAWDNFDVEDAEMSQRFPNTMDFWVTVNLS